MDLLPKNRKYFVLALILLMYTDCLAKDAKPLLEKGWQALVRDNDTTAFQYFGQAYLVATAGNNTEQKAQALLYMGICSYSVSYSRGLSWCLKAMEEYKKLEHTRPAMAVEGRSRCLQLISTIKGRQGLYRESIALSKEAMQAFPEGRDTTGYLGLIYNSLGTSYEHLLIRDSSGYFHRKALSEHLRSRNFTYLPGAYIKVAAIETELKNKALSFSLYSRALHIADSTGNRQAEVLALLGIGNWQSLFEKNQTMAEGSYLKAESIASSLTDKSFSLKATEQLLDFYKQTGDFRKAIAYKDKAIATRDSIYSWDRRKETRSLEMQFDVAEKERQLEMVKKEKEVIALTNYLLWGGIAMLLILSGGILTIQRRINKRDRLLLQTRGELVKAVEEQKALKERQMQQELEFKESQLSAMTVQMLQKNELMQELRGQLEMNKSLSADQALQKIINKGLNQDKDWSDFNTYFESINKHFYSRVKQAYPDISANDLRICALIKLNLSIKEMAGILNISPDSVKTARYRLRKKLQLNTEDNLADFILAL